MAVSHDTLASVRQPLAFHQRQERVGFSLDGLGQKATGAGPQNRRQRIVDLVGLTEENNGPNYLSWRIGSFGSSGRLSPALIRLPSRTAVIQVPA